MELSRAPRDIRQSLLPRTMRKPVLYEIQIIHLNPQGAAESVRTRGRQVRWRGELWRASCCFSGSFATWGQDHESRSVRWLLLLGTGRCPPWDQRDKIRDGGCGSHMPSSFSPLDICQILKLGRVGSR